MPSVLRGAALLALVLLAGCVDLVRMPTYVVEFTLTNTYGEARGVSEYPHCGTSELHDGYLKVQSPRPRGPALVHVDPTFERFAVLGSEGKAFGLAHDVHVPDGVDDTDFAIVVLSLMDGRLLIDGESHPLPYSGAAAVPGWWTANYTVFAGPGVVRVDHTRASCA